MHCVSCQAQLAAGSNHCYFCGTVQPAPAVSGPSTNQNAWFSTNPANEGWRIWASFFLGGLYAPIASSYLLERERAGIAGTTLPAPPSNRGLVVLALFIGLPFLSVIVLMLNDRIDSVGYSSALGDSYAWKSAVEVVRLNLFIAWFYVFSAVLSRRIHRRYAVLLYEVTGGSATAVAAFRRGQFTRWFAALLSAGPMLIVCWIAATMRWSGWDPKLDLLGSLFLLSVAVATWASSWLHINPIRRFRAAALGAPP